jgi:hypothetical protein
MPRRGSKQPYKPKVEYKYTIKDIAELAGMTRNALGVAKVHGDLFTPAARTGSRVKEGKSRANISRKRIKKTARRK